MTWPVFMFLAGSAPGLVVGAVIGVMWAEDRAGSPERDPIEVEQARRRALAKAHHPTRTTEGRSA